MEQLKEFLIEKAKKKYKDIVPCHPHPDFSKCFTEEGNKLIFWFNEEKSNSTRLMVSKIISE